MRTLMIGLFTLALVACGDKVPESKAAKDVGNVPKQTLDKATGNLNNAIQTNTDKLEKEDKKP
jgi:hypothetical protein